MTTNRMGLEQTLSDGELAQIVSGCVDGVYPTSQEISMARELLAYRKASKEAYGYVHKSLYEKGCSVGLSGDHEAYRDSSTHIPLYESPQIQDIAVPDEVTFEQAMLEVHGLSPAEAFQKAWSHLRESILKSVTNEL